MRFIGWALAIVLLFGIVYLPLISNWIRWWPSITFEKYPFHGWDDGLIDGLLFNIGTGIYLSISTFATLSFGNTNPVSLVGKFLVSLELVMGYVMFGILITLVARKMTRS